MDPFPITPLQTSFAVPPLAVLMLDYRPATLDVSPAAKPDGVAFTGAVPNPGVSSMRLDYSVRADTRVRLQLFDALGRRVRTLRDGIDLAGTHAVAWNGRDDAGRRVPRGVYPARLEADRQSITRRIVRVD